MGQDSDLLFVTSHPFTVLLLIKEMVMVQPKKKKKKKKIDELRHSVHQQWKRKLRYIWSYQEINSW